MDDSEADFRRVEAVLDKLLNAAEHELQLMGVRIIDQSARSYHYKNDYLSWSYAFQKDLPSGVETASVTVRLTYDEPMQSGQTPHIHLSWTAEIFQTGKISRIRNQSEHLCPLSELAPEGIVMCVLKAVRDGEDSLPTQS